MCIVRCCRRGSRVRPLDLHMRHFALLPCNNANPLSSHHLVYLVSKPNSLQALLLCGCRLLRSQNSLDQVADHLLRHLHQAAGQGAI